MHRPCWVTIAALCALAAAPATLAQRSLPPGEDGNPPANPQSIWPRTLPQSKPGEPATPSSPAWSAHEVDQARARCAKLLEGLDLVAIPHAPIREGAECGTPAPVQLVSIGSNPQIAFSPPPVLTCDMVAALHHWLEREVQPLARKHLGAPIVGVATMSSFSCRTAYSRANGRLSEHGRVNAIDIAGFLTAQGELTTVVADWGPIASEIAAKAIAAQAVAERQHAGAATKPQRQPEALRPAAPSVAPPVRGIVGEFPAIVIGEPPPGLSATGLGWAPPSRVGGPKPAELAPSGPPDGKGPFLHAAHRAACRFFATVLGPEANKAHRNHFHLDMAERKSANVCE